MAFSEHVSVKMGLDKSGFESGLKGARASLDTFKGALSALGVSFSLGAIKGFAGGILEMADTLDRQAQALDVSTDFLQGWQSAARQSGSDSETATKALDKFAAHLKETGREGADIETEIKKLADRMAATADPVTRVGLAVEAFGDKLGVRLVPTLQNGSKALAEFVANAKKLTPEEISRLQQFGDRLEEAQNNLKVQGGGLINSFFKLVEAAGAASATFDFSPGFGKDFIAAMAEASVQLDLQNALLSVEEVRRKRAAKAAAAQAIEQKKLAAAYDAAAKAHAEADFEGMDAAGKLAELTRFRDQVAASMTSKPTVENAQKLALLAKVGADIAKEQKAVEEKKLAIQKQQTAEAEKLNRARARQAEAERAIADAKADRSGLTLEQVANSTPATLGGARNVAAARAALNAEEFARRARLEGRDDLAEKATNFALGVRGRLSPLSTTERDPLRNLETNMAEANEALQTMLEKGVPIIPVTGE
jgi:hypothetical protein